MGRAYRSITVAVLGLLLYGSVRAQQASQPSKPKPTVEFMRAVKREIAKVGFEATEKNPAFRVSYQMSATSGNSLITGYTELGAKAGEVFENVQQSGLLDELYEVTFVRKTVRSRTRKLLDADGNEVKLKGKPVYQEVYEVTGQWRACSRRWQNYVPDTTNPALQTEEAARKTKDKVELVHVSCTIPKRLISLDDLESAQRLLVSGKVEDWAFRGYLFYPKAELYSAAYARAMAPALSGLWLHAESVVAE